MKRKPYIQMPIKVKNVGDRYEARMDCGFYAGYIGKIVGIGDTPELAINALRVAFRCLRRGY